MRFILIAQLILFFYGCGQKPSLPNIIIIFTDDQGYHDVSYYNKKDIETPSIDALAEAGMRFDNFYIAAFPCTPSRATYVTGRYPHNHGVVTNDVELDDALPSLGNTFRNAGYDTAWIGKWHLGDEGNLTLLGPDADLPWGKVVWGISAVYVCCAALRLARFSVETQPEKGPNDHLAFHGMPSPGAAGLIAALILLHQHVLANSGDTLWIGRAYAFGVPGVMLLGAIAMVSRIPYDHFVNRYLGRPQSFRFIAFLVIILFLCIWWFQETVAVGFVLYALSGPLFALRKKGKSLVSDES